ncbi:hypothetical protein [Luethyella okanaganae]|uniref:Tryptophan synthase subunit alpha n=1 Tax=Luethyella okanaganae TaxID=69372 RepID=A0ABW1VLA3_9MICO
MSETPPHLETLRGEARDELSAIIEFRCRLGEDPWEFLPELPSVDEQVVLTIRADRIDIPSISEARSRAYHPTARDGQAERFEFGLLRAIALEHPELTPAVWRLLDRFPQPG